MHVSCFISIKQYFFHKIVLPLKQQSNMETFSNTLTGIHFIFSRSGWWWWWTTANITVWLRQWGMFPSSFSVILFAYFLFWETAWPCLMFTLFLFFDLLSFAFFVSSPLWSKERLSCLPSSGADLERIGEFSKFKVWKKCRSPWLADGENFWF